MHVQRSEPHFPPSIFQGLELDWGGGFSQVCGSRVGRFSPSWKVLVPGAKCDSWFDFRGKQRKLIGYCLGNNEIL